MKGIFADTSYFIALTNRADQWHQQAMAYTRASSTILVTTAWIVVEFGNYMTTPRRRPVFKTIVDSLEADKTVNLVHFDDQLYREGLQLFHTRNDKEWSLTDCISFVTMQHEGLTEALSSDHHFEQSGYTILLK